MNKVIITGANGFIGSSLVNKLVQKGVEVIALDITFDGDHIMDSPMLTKIESGIENIEELSAMVPVDDYDAFYHFAWVGVNGPAKTEPDVQVRNIQIAVKCAKWAKQLGCKKFLCSGTVAEQGLKSVANLTSVSGGMIYAAAKHSCHIFLETYCKSICLPFVWMQFSNIYGVGNMTGNLVSYTLGELMAGKEATFGPALQPYDFIYVDDLIEAVYRLGSKDTNKPFYYIGSGSPRQLKEYLIRIGELAGCADKIGLGIRPDDGIKYSMEMFDNSSLLDTIGNYVVTDFDSGINKTIAWLKGLSTVQTNNY